MAQKQNITEVVLANRLTDGIVVYLGNDGSWVEHTGRAAVAYDERSRTILEAQANQGVSNQQIAGWEFTEAVKEGDQLRLTKNKHFIQSLGPTVRRDLGKQAEYAA